MKNLKVSVRLSLCVCFLLSLAFSSCNMEDYRPKPKAIGKAGGVLVVAEKALWEGVVGDAFRDYFIQPYPVLPQPESYFDLKHVTGEQFGRLQREWRVIIFLGNVSKVNATSKYIGKALGEEGIRRATEELDYNLAFRKDVWAEGQDVAYLFAPNDGQLIDNIKKRFGQIEQRILEKDLEKIKANTYQGGLNRKTVAKLKRLFNIELEVPLDFKEAIVDSLNSTVWLRRETRSTSSNILIKTLPYGENTQITKENLMMIRDLVGKEYITSSTEGAYMISDDVNLPIFYKEVNINGRYALEARGIWAMENDFMGGSFISYLVYDKDNQRVIFLDGFLYGPEEDKRPLMQRFEVIFSSLNI